MSKVTFFMLVLFVIGAQNSNPQAGASIVYDPTNAAQIGNMLTTLEKLKGVQEEWKSNTEFLAKIQNEGKEVKRLISLLESLVCATDEFDMFVGVVGNLTLCSRKLDMDITLGKLDGISSKLNVVVAGTYTLSQYETIESLKTLNDELEDGISRINDLNKDMRLDVVKSLNSIGSKKYGSQEVSWNADAGI